MYSFFMLRWSLFAILMAELRKNRLKCLAVLLFFVTLQANNQNSYNKMDDYPADNYNS